MTSGWLVSRRFDLAFFVGPAVVSLALVAPALLGLWPALDTPLWGWLLLVVAVDVSHVWTSLYRIYFDPLERARRPWLYGLTPLGVYGLSTLLYAADPAWFWTVLAYVAVHHFVRQQVGFVSLYRHRCNERDPLGRAIDHAAVYAGTLVPVVFWHTQLPRHFHWFVEGDFFTGLPPDLMTALWPIYGLTAGVYIAKRLHSRVWNPGKDLTVAATWSMWFIGIVALDSDYVFTATNILIHGVPYMALVWYTTHRRSHQPDAGRLLTWVGARRNVWAFVGIVAGFAFLEEGLWDVTVWQEHAAVFGDWSAFVADAAWVPLLFVPLLSVPQATHYVLDGFIWRLDGSNPGLRDRLFASQPSH